MTSPVGRRRLVPAYLATDGCAMPTPTETTLHRTSLLIGVGAEPPPDLTPAERGVHELLRGGVLTVAEVAAYTRLPVSITKVVASELVHRQLIRLQAPLPHDKQTLERVLDALRKL